MNWFFMIIFISLTVSGRAQEYYFRQMPSDYGRDIQEISILFQDSDHMMWIGTDNGLYSFDGRQYRYTPLPGGSTQTVSTISESPKGEKWVGYQDGSIQIITSKGHSESINTNSIKGFPISKILFQKNGDVFIATYGKGLWVIHKNQFTRLRFQNLEHIDDIYDALIDRQGRLWLGTDNGVWIYHTYPEESIDNLHRKNGLPDEIVKELEQQSNGDIWIGIYDYGLVRYSSVGKSINDTILSKAEEGQVVSLVNGNGDEVWVGFEKSINHYSYNKKVRSIKLPDDLNEHITNLFFDRTGNLWVSAGNKLFVANTQLDLRIPGVKEIQAIAVMNNKLWLGCKKGLFSMDQESGSLTQHLNEENLNIWSIYADPQGCLWIGTSDQGLYIYDPERNGVKHLTEHNGISNNTIPNIAGKANQTWLATLGGITEITWTDHPVKDELSITLFQEKYDFPAGFVYDIYVADDQKVWFATDGLGLYYLDGQELHHFTKPMLKLGEDSFDLRTIYSVTADAQNNIWVSGTKGNIFKLDPKGNLLEHISSTVGSENSLVTSGQGEIVIVSEGSIQVQNQITGISMFGATTGLTSFSPNINSLALDSDGSIWIADTEKVLHYKSIGWDSSHYVRMQWVDLTLTSKYLSDPIKLSSDSNFLDFHFTGVWYTDPGSVRYRYMLKEHDEDWIYTREGRAVYSKLSQGTYTFVVAGSHNDDFSKSVPIQRQIIVSPPFYLTWWFILCSLLFISFLAYLYMRERIRRISRFHQLEKEKTTFQLNAIHAQVNPHFLFNSFNTLSGIIEEDQVAAVDYVDQLSSFFRGVLLHRDSELISLSEEINIMRNYTYILKKRYGDNIVINEYIETLEGFIAPLSLQLLVENAIKHNIVSDVKPLTITITIDHKRLMVSNPIQPKIQSSSESTGFGLSSLLTRYQYLTSSCIEILNDGETFTVSIPVLQLNTIT